MLPGRGFKICDKKKYAKPLARALRAAALYALDPMWEQLKADHDARAVADGRGQTADLGKQGWGGDLMLCPGLYVYPFAVHGHYQYAHELLVRFLAILREYDARLARLAPPEGPGGA